MGSWPSDASIVSNSGQTPVVRRLGRLTTLDPHALALLEALGGRQSHRAGTELTGDRSAAIKPRFLVAGWVARVRNLPDGRRQIQGFLLPGDAMGLCFRPHPLALGTTVALTPVQTLDASAVSRAIEIDGEVWRSLKEAVHVSASLHEAYLLDHVTRLGRLTAYERLCHMLLEIYDRLNLAGMADQGRFALPLTQEMLADAMGLSTVHVNRTLQQLRRENLLELRGGLAVLMDIEAMKAVCDYIPPKPARWLSLT